MPRALTPALALLLAAGISVVGPNLIEPEPVAAPWSDPTAVAWPRSAGHESTSSGTLPHLTGVRAGGTTNSRPSAPADPENNNDPVNNNDPEERSTTCHAS